MSGLELDQLVVEPVVLGIRDRRVVVDVVRDGAWFSSARSSAARFVALEDAKELLRVIDEDVGLLALESLVPWIPPQATATA